LMYNDIGEICERVCDKEGIVSSFLLLFLFCLI